MSSEAPQNSNKIGNSGRTQKLSAFALVLLVWLVLDQASKAALNGAYAQGQVISDPILGIFRLHLVYNTGGAWSLFEGATWALGVFSLIVCIALLAYIVFASRYCSYGEALGLALIVSGGIGNAIDRFTLGYVVDFIEPTFIDFPVFNIADMGVTCGFVIFFIAYAVRERKAAQSESRDAERPL